MTKEIIEKRILELHAAIEQSAGNHNALIGRLTEAKELLDLVAQKADEAANDAIDVAVSE